MVVKSRKLPLAIFTALVLSLCFCLVSTKLFCCAVIAAAGCFFVLYDIRIGLMGAVFIYPFLPDVLGLLMFLSMGCFLLLRKILKNDVDIVSTAYGATIGLYFIVIVLNTFTSVNVGGSLRDLGLHMAGMSFVFALVNSIRSKEDLNGLISLLMLSALCVAAIGVLQFFTGVQMRAEWLDVENNPDIAARVYSVFLNPNILAEYLVLLTPVAVGLTWYTKRLKKKLLFTAATGVLLICLVMTMSRGGWVGICFAALAFVLMVDVRLILLGIPLGVAGLFFLPAKILERLLSIGSTVDSSNAYRLKIWEITLRVIHDHFIGGVGFGYAPFKQTFETYIRTMPIFHAHNTYLEIFAEMGIIGFVVFFIFLLTMLKHPILTLVRGEDKYYRYVAAGVISGIVGLFAHGLFEHVIYIPRIIFTFWIMVGLLLTMMRLRKREINAHKGEV